MKSSLSLTLTALTLLAGFLSPSARAEEIAGQVIGFYSKGKLKNATPLSMDGPGYIHLFQKRGRHFGSEGLIQIVERSAEQFFEWDPSSERLQIGDVAAQFGGHIGRHASHQNGLDVDLVYFRTNRHEQSLDHIDGFEETFVTKGGGVTSNFDTQRNWQFLQILMATGRVERIFVDPAIKREFCASIKAPRNTDEIEALRRLRPYPDHADHWHIRLTCPPTSPKCVVQAAVPAGDGCSSIDADLFTAELMEREE